MFWHMNVNMILLYTTKSLEQYDFFYVYVYLILTKAAFIRS